jgi:hypothetical protein
VFEKLVIGASGTGQTGTPNRSDWSGPSHPKTLSMKLTFHHLDEMARLGYEGLLAHSKALKARSHSGQLISTLTWSTH